jgi:hypothetical protein
VKEISKSINESRLVEGTNRASLKQRSKVMKTNKISKVTVLVLLGLILGTVSAFASNQIWVSDQSLTSFDRNNLYSRDYVILDKVMSDGPGWVVISSDKGEGADSILGVAMVNDGLNSNVKIKLDMSRATSGEKLFAFLHIDAGKAGTFEFPGPDVPATLTGAGPGAGSAIMGTFDILADHGIYGRPEGPAAAYGVGQ